MEQESRIKMSYWFNKKNTKEKCTKKYEPHWTLDNIRYARVEENPKWKAELLNNSETLSKLHSYLISLQEKDLNNIANAVITKPTLHVTFGFFNLKLEINNIPVINSAIKTLKPKYTLLPNIK